MARKILLADDSVTAQNMGRKILVDAGYDVSTVNNGSAALKRITESKPDLIVLDVYMPGYSGLEVCQRLKDSTETSHIPVLLTVGKLEPFKPEEARRVKADAHIVKPFEASELLTAITRLEDRMVPQQSDGSRFSTSVSGLERFDGAGRKTETEAEADGGWKSRLRFPTKKKKDEKEEAEELAATENYRDYRRGRSKLSPAPITVKAPPPPGQEPGLVPDIPRDITPEELDVLSAVAAQLDGPVPAAENIAPQAANPPATPKTAAAEIPTEIAAAKTEVAKAEFAVAAAAEEAKKEEAKKDEDKKKEEKTEIAAPALAIAAPSSTVSVKSEVEIPVEHTEPAVETLAVVANPPAVEIQQTEAHAAEAQAPGTPTALVAETVNAALLPQEPAPVDKTDEPIFASTASLLGPAPQDEAKTEAKIEANPAEAVATSDTTEKIEPMPASAAAEAVTAKAPESKPAESKPEFKADDLEKKEMIAPPPVAASAPKPVEAEGPEPSDAELAEALRLLTPATGNADGLPGTIPSHGTLVAAGQLLAEEVARHAAAGPRWVAERVALSPEEAAISLEAEMFKTFAVVPEAASASGGEFESPQVSGVSAIAAAVENRLAEAGLSAGSLPREVAPEPIATQNPSEQKEFQVPAGDEAPATEVAAATFADAVGRSEIETAAQENIEPVRMTSDAATSASAADSSAQPNQDSRLEPGEQESMAKDAKGKSNWQTRNAQAKAAVSDNAEAAAQAEEAPKAMAATAAAEGSASSSDASAIASIVDSVMADLRPKIVAEIAKKLAKKD